MENSEIINLILSCRAHDNEAFSELVVCYTPLMSGEALAFANAQVGFEELFSEACIALHSAVMKYDINQKSVTFGLYAKVCIHNRLIDFISSFPKSQENLDIDEISVNLEMDKKLADAERFEQIMRQSKKILSDYEYKVLILHIQGYKTARIGEILGRDRKSVDNAKNRIFKRLRESFNGE